DFEEPAGRNFIENMSKKQRPQCSLVAISITITIILAVISVFVCNLNEVPT
ncbi:unnamed protein product, partial [Symbiodinium sp. KB8]